jgi:eukaryotic-like serine/threonine-protein kinase
MTQPRAPISSPPLLGDRYHIERELGRGGMATVFQARDRKLGRDVAVKILHPHIAAVLGTERFLREIEIAAQLQHPHIVALIEAGETDEAPARPFYVMPLIEGETLRQRLEREVRLSLAEALRLARQMADALHYAHGKGVIHRDVKPENVLLLESGHALVTDFGIARALHAAGADRLTFVGLPIGTPGYMSPEQVAASDQIDARADQYSLACVIFEMVAGAPPFSATSAARLMARHLSEEAPRLTAARPDVPAGVSGALCRAFAKDPADRYADVLEMVSAVEAPGPAVDIAAPSIVVLPFTNASLDPDTDHFADGLTEEVIADLSNVRSVRVIARNSTMRLKGTDKDAPTLGRELSVRFVLAGSIRRAGDRLRITAYLVDATSDRQVWAGKFGGTVADVFALQEKLAREIVGALRVTLSPEEDRALATRNVDDFAAFETDRVTTLDRLDDYLRHLQTYQRVRDEVYRFTDASVERAIRLAREGLATLGESELLLSALCHALIGAEWIGLDQDLTEAEQCVATIFERWPDSAYGHLLRGAIEYRRGRPKAALVSLERARRVRPNDADVLIYCSVSYWMLGQSKPALEAIELALAVDPLNPVNWNMSGLVRLFQGDLEGSIAELRHGAALGDETPMCQATLALALMAAGRDDEAGRVFERVAARFPTDPYVRLWHLVWYARRGETKRVREGFTREVIALVRVDEGCTYVAAAALALIGEIEPSIRCLEHMVRDRGLIAFPYFSTIDPFLANVRADSRGQALLAEMRARYEENLGKPM